MKGYFFINNMQTAGFFKPSNKTGTKKKKTKKPKEVLLQNLKAPVQKLGCFKMCTV